MKGSLGLMKKLSDNNNNGSLVPPPPNTPPPQWLVNHYYQISNLNQNALKDIIKCNTPYMPCLNAPPYDSTCECCESRWALVFASPGFASTIYVYLVAITDVEKIINGARVHGYIYPAYSYQTITNVVYIACYFGFYNRASAFTGLL